MDERVWRLPGPRTFVQDIISEVERGRHVVVLLPRHLSLDVDFTDSLAVLLVTELCRSLDARRVLPDVEAHSLLDTIARSLVFDDVPATVPDLLVHPEAAGSVAVLVVTDLPPDHQLDVASIVDRIGTESRIIRQNERPRLVTICTSDHLPTFTGQDGLDVTIATLWWWNRIAHWDVAAYITDRLRSPDVHRLIKDIQAETIVEVARWNLPTADHLCQNWSGDPAELDRVLNGDANEPNVGTSPGDGSCGRYPGPTAIEPWNSGILDGWHDRYSFVLWTPEGKAGGRVRRAVWAAQARILLPWIEERRDTLQLRLSDALGHERFLHAVHDLFDPPLDPNDVIEIGPLRKVAERFGRSEPLLLSAVRRLFHARNGLAHLQPLALAELTELVAACRCLDRR